MSQRVRLSGEDIQFINQLRGYKQPVYEVVNGRLCFRVTLTNEELNALHRNIFRIHQNQKVKELCFLEDHLQISLKKQTKYLQKQLKVWRLSVLE